MTTAAERKAHKEAGLRASDFPAPPIPPAGWPNAEWLEDYRRWHAAYARALNRQSS